MNQSTVLNGWSELAPELLDIIARCLTNYVDYVRVRAVCPLWRENLPRKPNHLLPQIPWLILPQYNNITAISETHCRFFNLADSKGYHLELPEVLGEGKRCWGSPHGWLVLLHGEGPLFSLLNPLTRDRIQLPSLSVFTSMLQNDQVVKAVLFANPCVSTDFVVTVIMEEGPCGLAFFKFGTEAWTMITNTDEIIFRDVVCYEGQFFAVDEDGIVYICNLGTSPNVEKVVDPPETVSSNAAEQKYLVESVKELLLVYRYQLQIPGTPFGATYYFTIYKLDLGEAKWSEVHDLGDQVLFLGTNCSFSLSAQNYPSCRENSVYFTDDKRYTFGFLVNSEGMNGYTKGYYLGVFKLDGGLEPIPCCPIPDPYRIKYKHPPPVWVTLSP